MKLQAENGSGTVYMPVREAYHLFLIASPARRQVPPRSRARVRGTRGQAFRARRPRGAIGSRSADLAHAGVALPPRWPAPGFSPLTSEGGSNHEPDFPHSPGV